MHQGLKRMHVLSRERPVEQLSYMWVIVGLPHALDFTQQRENLLLTMQLFQVLGSCHEQGKPPN